jgi:hypothetical protein
MNSPYSDIVATAIAKVAQKIDSLTLKFGYNWRNPASDLAERIAFSVIHVRTIQLCVTGSVRDRHSYWVFGQELLDTGIYMHWSQYPDSYSLPTRCDKRDLLIIVCTQAEYDRFLRGGDDRRGNNVAVFVDRTFTKADAIARIKKWQSSWLP